jgi:hypothetical protein
MRTAETISRFADDVAYSASTDTTLETAASIRSDCVLTLAAPVRRCADGGAGNPSLLPARFRAAANRVGP